MKRYDKTFKEQALKLSDEIGTKKAAEQLGLKYYTLSGWRKNRKDSRKASTSDKNEFHAHSKLELKLLAENAKLKEANSILKDALGFFAEDRKR